MDSLSTIKHRRIFLWSHPRTVSNVFRRMIDPDVKQYGYPLLVPLLFGPDRMELPSPTKKWGTIKQAIYPIFKDLSMQDAVDNLQEDIAKAEAEGRSVLVKEHVTVLLRLDVLIGIPELVKKIEDRQLDIPTNARAKALDDSPPITNPTLLPDRFLRTFSPVFTIRHPARMISSYLRAAKRSFDETQNDPGFAVHSSYKWTRQLYEWYKSQPGCEVGWPIVVDGDELISNPEGIMEGFCRMTGWDGSRLRYSWDLGLDSVKDTYHDVPEEAGEWQESFFGTLAGSTGVQKDEKLLFEPKLQEERSKWVAEFGEEAATSITAAVEGAMPDYYYLKQLCIKV